MSDTLKENKFSGSAQVDTKCEGDITLQKIAQFLGTEFRGDADYVLSGIAPLPTAKKHQLSFLEKASFRKYLATTEAGAIILSLENANDYQGNVIIAKNPYASYAKVSQLFAKIPYPPSGIHEKAVIGKNCQIDPSAKIANCTIGNNVKIGKNAIIHAGCVLSDDVDILDNTILYPNVTVYHQVSIGNRVIIHSGAVIGADGFGMAPENGIWHKIQQLGSVIIGDDVEIGANTCIDRGALDDTIIEPGVKLDNLIQIGHNAIIGANTVIAGCTAVAGSAKIGKNCMIGGAVTINGHLEIADRTVIAGDSTVGKTISEPGIYSSCFTVHPHYTWLKTITNLPQLDKLFKRVQILEERLHADNDEH